MRPACCARVGAGELTRAEQHRMYQVECRVDALKGTVERIGVPGIRAGSATLEDRVEFRGAVQKPKHGGSR